MVIVVNLLLILQPILSICWKDILVMCGLVIITNHTPYSSLSTTAPQHTRIGDLDNQAVNSVNDLALKQM